MFWWLEYYRYAAPNGASADTWDQIRTVEFGFNSQPLKN
jgi:hypothetical protein